MRFRGIYAVFGQTSENEKYRCTAGLAPAHLQAIYDSNVVI